MIEYNRQNRMKRDLCGETCEGHFYVCGKEVSEVPRKPKKPCAFPGCPNLTDETYCEKHKDIARKQYDRYERPPDVHKTYGRCWSRIRTRYAKEHPLCERCLEEGRVTPMAEVHHIVPISRGGTHERSNLRSLCRSCHQKTHIELGDRRTDGS